MLVLIKNKVIDINKINSMEIINIKKVKKIFKRFEYILTVGIL